jgi:hypothetical protein
MVKGLYGNRFGVVAQFDLLAALRHDPKRA